VLPFVLSKRGKLVFHASAVAIEGGVVAFAGVSGQGKSTLAASFAVNGFPVVTDDVLVLEPFGQVFVVQPSYPSIRLWEDSEEAIFSKTVIKAAALDYTPKGKILSDTDLEFCNRTHPLRKVYFLGDCSVATVELKPLSASEALVEWLQHSFLLDVEERTRLASHFDQVASLASQVVHFRLNYPRRYDHLHYVRGAILENVGANGRGRNPVNSGKS
jgi:hypothetical protein